MPGDEKTVAQEISKLAAEIQSPDLERRRSAAQEIYDLCYNAPELAKPAIPVLLPCLADPDEKIGESALWGLKYCAPESIEPLIDCLADPRALVRERASHSLGNIGDEAAPAGDALRKLLGDPAAEVRTRAAWAIGLIHDTSERTIAALFEMAKSPDARARGASFHALGNIGEALVDPQPLRAKQKQILEALDDENEDVRWSAGYALEALHLEPARHVELIMQRLEHEPSDRVREQRMGQLKQLAAEVELSPYLPAMCRILRNAGRESRLACELLADMRERALAAVPYLIETLRRDDDFLAIEAAKALWTIDRRVTESLPALARAFEANGESACDAICLLGRAAAPLIPKVLEALGAEDWDLQWAAADALGHVAADEPEVVAALASSLAHPSGIVASAAAGALGKIGAPAVPALRAILLDDADPRGEWAADALGRVGPAAADSVDLLRKHVGASNAALATWSAIGLAKVAGDPSVVPSLVKLLQDERSDLREQAAAGLKAIGPAANAAVPALNLALSDEDERVRTAAAEALSAISSRPH
jgi:HEAT repeat protein